MYKTIEIVHIISFSSVTYYSVRLDGAENTLFDDFLTKHESVKYKYELDYIRSWLVKIGQTGAKETFFRNEAVRGGEAKALPPKSNMIDIKLSNFTLRLYCMRFNANIVFLFSGAVKTARVAQDCFNVKPHFELANKISKSIAKSFKSGDIRLSKNGNYLIFDNDFKIELL